MARIAAWPWPGTRIVGVLVGVVVAIVYVATPPAHPSASWAGTAAQVLATLLLALVLDARAFRTDGMRKRDALSAALVLAAAVIALIFAVATAAYDSRLTAGTGAVVVGASVSLTWIVMTDVMHALICRAFCVGEGAGEHRINS